MTMAHSLLRVSYAVDNCCEQHVPFNAVGYEAETVMCWLH
jgi:hypothetical protein